MYIMCFSPLKKKQESKLCKIPLKHVVITLSEVTSDVFSLSFCSLKPGPPRTQCCVYFSPTMRWWDTMRSFDLMSFDNIYSPLPGFPAFLSSSPKQPIQRRVSFCRHYLNIWANPQKQELISTIHSPSTALHGCFRQTVWKHERNVDLFPGATREKGVLMDLNIFVNVLMSELMANKTERVSRRPTTRVSAGAVWKRDSNVSWLVEEKYTQ